jgi:replicative DNA helicase
MEAKKNIKGIPSGYSEIDMVTSGWKPSDLIVIAGRLEVGKTSFALLMARYIAVDENIPLAYFSLDLSNVQLVSRLLDAEKIQRPDEWKRLDKDVNVLMDAPLYVDDTQEMSLADIRTKVQELVHQHNVQIIIIDNLQLLNTTPSCHSLKDMAVELNIPIIVVSQQDDGIVSQFKDFNDADIVLSVNRPDGNDRDAQVVISKNGKDETGEVMIRLKK